MVTLAESDLEMHTGKNEKTQRKVPWVSQDFINAEVFLRFDYQVYSAPSVKPDR